jgi:hypothetical protein
MTQIQEEYSHVPGKNTWALNKSHKDVQNDHTNPYHSPARVVVGSLSFQVTPLPCFTPFHPEASCLCGQRRTWKTRVTSMSTFHLAIFRRKDRDPGRFYAKVLES